MTKLVKSVGETNNSSGFNYSSLIRDGAVTTKELMEKTLAQIKKFSELNAFISSHIRSDTVPASNLSNKKSLHGIPFAAKDNFSTSDFRTTCGSKMLANYHPPYNATVVQRLIDNGAVLIGKTNLDEFAMGSGCIDSHFGPTKNPWTLNTKYANCSDNWHITGGSSGGSAAAVAIGACSFALGSDTGGSVRNPAAYCGVIGVKPTYGLISRHGLISLVNSCDVPGIFARSAEDAELILKILCGHDTLDSTTYHVGGTLKQPTRFIDNLAGLNIGIPKEFDNEHLDSEMSTLLRRCADMLQQHGGNVQQVSLPHSMLSVACYSVLCAAEVMSNHARYDGLRFGHRANVSESTNALFAETRKEGFGDNVRSRILIGSYFLLKENREKYYEKALKVRRLIHDDFVNVFDENEKSRNNFKADILLTPVTVGDAPLYKDFIQNDNRTNCLQQDIFTQPTNLAGVPSISVPIGLSKNGLPLSIQIIGPKFSDLQLFEIAKIIEDNVKFPCISTLFREKLVKLKSASL